MCAIDTYGDVKKFKKFVIGNFKNDITLQLKQRIPIWFFIFFLVPSDSSFQLIVCLYSSININSLSID